MAAGAHAVRQLELPIELPIELPEAVPGTRILLGVSTLAALGVALAARLAYLLVFSDSQNPGDGLYTDAYHHWQIGFLSGQVGLAQGRLWDLKGMEYFWGLLHPALLALLFWLTSSSDIVIPRLLSAAAGAAVVVLLFQLCSRYWGNAVGAAAAAIAAVVPVAVLNDSAGLEEQIGLALMLGGMLLLPRRPFWAGLLWGLAAMDRSELWLFTVFLILAGGLHSQRTRRLPLLAGWAAIVLPYMWFLYVRTGNPVYPIYWNIAGNGAGRWVGTYYTTEQMAARPFFALVLLASSAGFVWVMRRRPSGALLLGFGFAFTAFVCAVQGFTAYLSQWQPWMWYSRRFELTWLFAGILLAIALLRLAPQWLGRRALVVSLPLLLAVLAGSQAMWIPLRAAFTPTAATWAEAKAAGVELARVHAQVGGGSVNIPADHPDVTYALVHYGGLSGHEVAGQMYDPFFYRPAWRYADHPQTATVLLQCWLQSTQTSVWAVPESQNYEPFIAAHPDWFQEAGSVQPYGWSIYVVSAPKVSPAGCAAAVRSRI